MKKYLITFLATFSALVIFLTLTNPSSLSISLLVFPVILIFLSISLLVIILAGLWDKELLRSRRVKVVAFLLGTLSALFLLFQSSGGLSWSDTVLVLLILVISYFYSSKI